MATSTILSPALPLCTIDENVNKNKQLVTSSSIITPSTSRRQKSEKRRERAVTSICRVYNSVSTLAKEYTALFMTTQGMMGVRHTHTHTLRHEQNKRKVEKNDKSNDGNGSKSVLRRENKYDEAMVPSPYDNHRQSCVMTDIDVDDDDDVGIGMSRYVGLNDDVKDDVLTSSRDDVMTCSSGIHTMDSSPVHEVEFTGATTEVEDLFEETGHISRHKYGTEFLMNQENSDKTISPLKNPSLSATLSRKSSSLSRKLSWRSLSSRKSVSPMKNSDAGMELSPHKCEVLCSETRRINELFRKKKHSTTGKSFSFSHFFSL